ncbi:hypothetical protein ROZALSC1DRAFT_25058 [Rozella allomycis CSF55]|nr:hypothetical protein ROZALSC1DRAFT_25058 [Rozella allomycis CSF55]
MKILCSVSLTPEVKNHILENPADLLRLFKLLKNNNLPADLLTVLVNIVSFEDVAKILPINTLIEITNLDNLSNRGADDRFFILDAIVKSFSVQTFSGLFI